MAHDLYTYLEDLWREQHAEVHKAHGRAPFLIADRTWHDFIDEVVGDRRIDFAAKIEGDNGKWVLGLSEDGTYLFRLESEGGSRPFSRKADRRSLPRKARRR